jgi:sugar phosphate isomerase/epimerase
MMMLGIDSWSYSFAFGVRDVKPSHQLTVEGLLERVRGFGLQGAQVEVPQMPPLDSPRFGQIRDEVRTQGLFLEVSAGRVQDEERVLQALEHSAVLDGNVVRAFMEGFGIQFRDISLDDYVTDAMGHIANLLPHFERRGMYLCLENHGGLHTHHLRRVLDAFPSEHLALCLDTGNAVFTLEDPATVVAEFAPRTRTCHLKDWRLIRSADGLVVRSCALGEGVVDLPAALATLARSAPCPEELHLNIEAPQEYLALNLFTSEFWRHHADVTGAELGHILRLSEERGLPAGPDERIASMRGADEATILAEEHAAVERSVRYCRETLGLK